MATSTITSGAIYAESFIQWAADGGDCVTPSSYSLSAGPCLGPAQSAATALANPALYAGMIDAFSMRNWQLSGQSGHDHFFDTFGKFGQATDGNTDKMLAETASRAASQHEIYQELMLTPTSHELETLAKSLGWNDDFSVMQQKLLANGLPQILATASQQVKAAVCDGTISPAEGQRLESLLVGNAEAERFFVAYLELHGQIQWLSGRGSERRQ